MDREWDYDGGNMFVFSSCRFGGSESDLDEYSVNFISM